jgi:hypothetical protein
MAGKAVAFATMAGLPVAIARDLAAHRTFGDPVDLLSMRVSEVEKVVVASRSLDTLLGERRIVENLDLVRGRGDTVSLVVSLPAPLPDHPIPVMIILGGLEVGEKTLEFIADQGPNAYVAYRYPYDPVQWRERAKMTQVPVIREAVLSVPGQVSTMLRWVREQSWADADRTSLLGFSLGALLLPATYRVAARAAPPSPPAVLAYGGTDIHMLLDAYLDVRPAWLRSALARLAQLAIRPVEPGLHAPNMEGGPFLLINGSRDEQIPRASYLALQRLVPEPKEVLMLDEGHMHPRRVDLTRRIVDLTREWLADEGFYDRAEVPRHQTNASGP